MLLAHGDDEDVFAWHAGTFVLIGVAAAAVAYTALVAHRQRRAGGRVPWASVASFAAGLAVCVLALESPLDPIGESG